MSERSIDLSGLAAERHAEFKRLTRGPAVAWPTIAVWGVVLGGYTASDVLAVVGVIPLWVGMIANSVIGYYAFTVVHDGIHRAICRSARLNDCIAQTAVVLGSPYVSLALFRWAHIQHHRFANGPRDPDRLLHGAWWTLPLRWMGIDAIYLVHILRHGDRIAYRHLRGTIPWVVGSALLVGVLVAEGHGMAVLMLWFLPSRIIFLTLGFSFFWLPHVPHDTLQEENFTRATTVRIGHEWLMAPLLQGHHYHLVHHLYPTTPFYNNEKVWKLLESRLRRCDLAVQYGFAIRPTIHPAPAADAVRGA